MQSSEGIGSQVPILFKSEYGMTSPSRIISRDFYRSSPIIVAPALIGKLLVRNIEGSLVSGIINETEAYMGDIDSASHAFKGKTPRNQVMFGEPGHAYVYFVYGLYNMLNIVVGNIGEPWVVLIREIIPVDGIGIMKKLRGREKNLTNGPGRLCKALAVDRNLNGIDLTIADQLWVESGMDISKSQISSQPRIGIDYALPEHKAAHWRFTLKKGVL